MHRYKSRSYVFVGLQIVLFFLYIFPISDIRFQHSTVLGIVSLITGFSGLSIIAAAIIQLNKNLTPFPDPVQNGTLIQSGLYKYSRHPIYAGIILAALGFGCYSGSLWKIASGILLWVLFYFKSEYEESLLIKRFHDYHKYRDHTHRFFPFF